MTIDITDLLSNDDIGDYQAHHMKYTQDSMDIYKNHVKSCDVCDGFTRPCETARQLKWPFYIDSNAAAISFKDDREYLEKALRMIPNNKRGFAEIVTRAHEIKSELGHEHNFRIEHRTIDKDGNDVLVK